VQHFFNHAAIERAAAEAFSSPRARLYLYGTLGLATAIAAGLAMAAAWLALILFAEHARQALLARFPRDAHTIGKALDVARAACLAAAPALAWFSGGALGAATALLMLAALSTQALTGGAEARAPTLLTQAPYAALLLAFLGDAAGGGDIGLAAAALLGLSYIFGLALHHAHRLADLRAQDSEWLRQLNMNCADGEAVWEIDFGRGELYGAERLSSVLGVDVTYADMVAATFSAAPERAVAEAAFAPTHGAPRRIVFEHTAIARDGAHVPVRHDAFVRAAPDGSPLRLTCVTRRVALATSAASGNELDALIGVQHAALTMLGNELSRPYDLSRYEGSDPTRRLQALVDGGAALTCGIEDLARARHEAESANLAKSQFLTNMSHELRTPLNAIIGYAEMLQEDAQGDGDDIAAQDLGRILGSARHLLTLINEILDLSKIEAGRVEVSAAEFDVGALLCGLVDSVRPVCDANHNQIIMNLGAAPLLASSDATKIGQCVLNLLSNAAKFTQDGAIDIALELRAVGDIEHIAIIVRDTGIGISADQLGKLFQPFVQADRTITQRFGGTGLGLTITRRLAQLLGGDVVVESTLGQGSCFTLLVPRNLADAARARGAAAQVDAVQGHRDAPLVLVIEDEPNARELAARALTRAGFAVQGVGGGDAGLALARAKSPALVLLDIFLPDRSGWRVLQSLKQDPKTQDIPVVVLSVNEDRAHALSLGAAEHLVKPADRDALAATVMRFARKRADDDSAAPLAPAVRLARS
jgi:signal transduction histidine kinase/ActR/RegA family two-component response regulator